MASTYTAMPPERRRRHVLRLVLVVAAALVVLYLATRYTKPRFPAPAAEFAPPL